MAPKKNKTTAAEPAVTIPRDVKILERIQAQWDFARLTPEQQAAKRQLLRDLDEVDAHLGLKEPTKATPPVPTLDPTSRILTVNGKHFTLTQGQRDVLAALISRRSAGLQDLRNANDRPDRVLKDIRKKYPALKKHIVMPGGGGKGGYSTTIEFA